MKPLVSILIPAYNAAPLLAQTLKTAVEQTWPAKEIILVDDGSRDETVAVARQFGSNVQIFSQRNQGAAAARNKAFSLSKGDYIQWLDADDLLSPDKIEKQMQVLERGCSKRTLISCSWALFMYRPERARFKPSPLWSDLSPQEWMVRKWEHNVYMQTATWLPTRELTAAAGPWDSRLLGDDDGEYFSRVILASDSVKFAPEGKVYYRKLGSGSLSYVGLSDKKLEAQFLGMKLQIGYLRGLDESARARAACVKYLQDWLPNFYPNRLDLVAECQELAKSLGGQLTNPRFSWKYAWIERLFGAARAKRASVLLPGLKSRLKTRLDRLCWSLSNGTPGRAQ